MFNKGVMGFMSNIEVPHDELCAYNPPELTNCEETADDSHQKSPSWLPSKTTVIFRFQAPHPGWIQDTKLVESGVLCCGSFYNRDIPTVLTGPPLDIFFCLNRAWHQPLLGALICVTMSGIPGERKTLLEVQCAFLQDASAHVLHMSVERTSAGKSVSATVFGFKLKG